MRRRVFPIFATVSSPLVAGERADQDAAREPFARWIPPCSGDSVRLVGNSFSHSERGLARVDALEFCLDTKSPNNSPVVGNSVPARQTSLSILPCSNPIQIEFPRGSRRTFLPPTHIPCNCDRLVNPSDACPSFPWQIPSEKSVDGRRRESEKRLHIGETRKTI